MTILIVDFLLRVGVWTRLSHGGLGGAFGVYGELKLGEGEETGQMVGVVDMHDSRQPMQAWLQMDDML